MNGYPNVESSNAINVDSLSSDISPRDSGSSSGAAFLSNTPGNNVSNGLELWDISQDPDYDENATVIRPYEIEEPDDDNGNNNDNSKENHDDDNDYSNDSFIRISKVDTPSDSSDTVDQLQEDLVDSIQDLNCNPGADRARVRPGLRRGLKRRPSGSAASNVYPRSASWIGSSQGINSRCETKYIGPKRLRKQRSRPKRDLLFNSRGVPSLQAPEGNQLPQTLEHDAPSTEASAETSATDTGNEMTDADAMDVD